MKKISTILFLCLLLYAKAWANQSPTAIQISVNTTPFNKNLNSGDTTVQAALQTIDQFNFASGSGVTFTDGVHTVSNATQLTVSGGTIGGVAPNATLTVSGSGAAYYTWNSISSTTQTLVTANGYMPTSASLTTFTLPVSPSIGDHYYIVGVGSGGWTLAQNASQMIYLGNKTTTTGTGGSLASSNSHDAIEILCIATNTFEIMNVLGNITVT
jgi:hypothetical protein